MTRFVDGIGKLYLYRMKDLMSLLRHALIHEKIRGIVVVVAH
jgi:hypothetical protein